MKKLFVFLVILVLAVFISGFVFLTGGYSKSGTVWKIVPEKASLIGGILSLPKALEEFSKSKIFKYIIKDENLFKKSNFIIKFLFKGEIVAGYIDNGWFFIGDLGYKNFLISHRLKSLSKISQFNIKRIKFKEKYYIFVLTDSENREFHVFTYKNYLIIAKTRIALLAILDTIFKKKGSFIKNVDFPADFYISEMQKNSVYLMYTGVSAIQSPNSHIKKEASLICGNLENLSLYLYVKSNQTPYEFTKRYINSFVNKGIVKSEKYDGYEKLSLSQLSNIPFSVFSIYFKDTGKKIIAANSKYIFEKLIKKDIKSNFFCSLEVSTFIFLLNLYAKANPEFNLKPFLPFFKKISDISVEVLKADKKGFLTVKIAIELKK